MSGFLIPPNPYADGVDPLVEIVCAMCDARDLAMMFGASLPQAAKASDIWRDDLEAVCRKREGRSNPSRVRCYDARRSTIDWSKATPRPDEKTWSVLKANVFRRDGYVCTYCGDTETKFTADHVIPLSRGGTNDLTNLVACCIPCNNSKSHRFLSEWRGRYK